MVKVIEIEIGDVVKLKKPHPCGANEWEVTKLGMDIALTCVGCGRKVRLIRYDFDRRFRGFISRYKTRENESQTGIATPAEREETRKKADTNPDMPTPE